MLLNELDTICDLDCFPVQRCLHYVCLLRLADFVSVQVSCWSCFHIFSTFKCMFLFVFFVSQYKLWFIFQAGFLLSVSEQEYLSAYFDCNYFVWSQICWFFCISLVVKCVYIHTLYTYFAMFHDCYVCYLGKSDVNLLQRWNEREVRGWPLVDLHQLYAWACMCCFHFKFSFSRTVQTYWNEWNAFLF